MTPCDGRGASGAPPTAPAPLERDNGRTAAAPPPSSSSVSARDASFLLVSLAPHSPPPFCALTPDTVAAAAAGTPAMPGVGVGVGVGVSTGLDIPSTFSPTFLCITAAPVTEEGNGLGIPAAAEFCFSAIISSIAVARVGENLHEP